MFDIGFFELCVIGIVALLVLGPERLPKAARTAGMWVGRAKRMIAQVKRDIDEELRQEELKELRELKDVKETLSKTRESINSFKEELNKQIDSEPETSREATGTPSEPSTDGEEVSKQVDSEPEMSREAAATPSEPSTDREQEVNKQIDSGPETSREATAAPSEPPPDAKPKDAD